MKREEELLFLLNDTKKELGNLRRENKKLRNQMKLIKQKRIKLAVLEGCDDHPEGCYIRFKYHQRIKESDVHEVVYDYNFDGELVGIELLPQVYGANLNKKKVIK